METIIQSAFDRAFGSGEQQTANNPPGTQGRIEQAQRVDWEQKASEEAKLYNQGRNMLTNVIQSRDSVQDQKAKLVENFARYHRLIIQLRAFMDELLD